MDTTPPPVIRTEVCLSTDGGWPAVRQVARHALESMLSAGDPWDLVLAEVGDTHRYVQLHCDPLDGAFYAEVASNHHLAPHAQLGLDEELGLLERGWHPPSGVAARDGDGRLTPAGGESDNFWRYVAGVDEGLAALDELVRCHTFASHAVLELQLFECALGAGD